MPENLPVAIVIPWFGRDLTGGAELQAWQIAERLGMRGHSVEVLTTACKSAHDHYGENHYKPGCYREEHFIIRRFKVARRNEKALSRALRAIHSTPPEELFPGCSPVPEKVSGIFAKELISSPSLLRFLRKKSESYHAFIFLPYLFGPILKGLPLVADKAYLQPCLHDEWYAYFPEVAEVFRKAKGLLFNSEGEFELARKLYGPLIGQKSHLIGEGVEVELGDSTDHLKPHAKVGEAPFVFYLGKKCKEKNVDLLVEAYRRFKHQHPKAKLKLVLAGSGDSYASGLDNGALIDLGKVSVEEKWQLITQCRCLVQPSTNESFSRVIFEAWHAGRPVAVNANCLATQMAVERSGGGWTAGTLSEWSEFMEVIEAAGHELASTLGAQGQTYARQIANWDAVMDRYESVLFNDANLSPKSIEIREDYPRIPIHQLSAGFASGDAISNIALKFRDYLREKGFSSHIYAEHACRKAQQAGHVRSLKHFKARKAGLLLYHHSINSAAVDEAMSFDGVKALVYHNVTPPELVESENIALAEELRRGIERLPLMRDAFDFFAADSEFNGRELVDCGIPDPLHLPCFVDFENIGNIGNERVMRLGQKGITNILFVGRISPHKQQHLLIEGFARYLRHNPSAHLYIVGGGDASDLYYQSLLERICISKLQNHVTLTGKVSDAELVSYFRIADLYWSFSAHEGFGIPLIEAMALDVPVLAYRAAAIPEVMGQGGLIFNDLSDLNKVAALASVLVKDKELRSNIIAAQRENVKRFTWENSRQIFAGMINQLLEKKFGRTTATLSN